MESSYVTDNDLKEFEAKLTGSGKLDLFDSLINLFQKLANNSRAIAILPNTFKLSILKGYEEAISIQHNNNIDDAIKFGKYLKELADEGKLIDTFRNGLNVPNYDWQKLKKLAKKIAFENAEINREQINTIKAQKRKFKIVHWILIVSKIGVKGVLLILAFLFAYYLDSVASDTQIQLETASFPLPFELHFTVLVVFFIIDICIIDPLQDYLGSKIDHFMLRRNFEELKLKYNNIELQRKKFLDEYESYKVQFENEIFGRS